MPVTARPSATVVLVRPAQRESDGWETYLLRRSAQSPVLAEMWVFPGGTVRGDDLKSAAQVVDSNLGPAKAHAIFSRPPDLPAPTPLESYAHFVAAARELVEEAGILLSNPGRNRPGDAVDTTRFASQRNALEHGQPLAAFLEETGATLALDQLAYYAHWITPEALPQRFDTRFFVARLPDGQEASPSPFEMADGLWISATDALDRARAGALNLHFATLNHLRRLAPYVTVDDLFAFAATKTVVPVMPHTREKDGRLIPSLAPELEGLW
jgi:8-oxo-dGTP pyrophosphatase MutT (NUDIX family)